jgi:aminoglycoside phosphotransferase family enzyme
LAVGGISNTSQEPHWKGRVSPVEYAVKMRHFDKHGRLDRGCAQGELKSAHLSDLARTLVAFHAKAEIAPAASRFDAVEQVIRPRRKNFRHLKPLLPQSDMALRLAALQAWTETKFTQLKLLLEARKQAGWVRECLGDLQLGNLVLFSGQVRLFDCIELNEELPWIDVVSEIAFTHVDLLAHAQPGLTT